jgi:uncharacterized membrane-anchored protein YjiN (DUF445 family)
MNNWFLRHKGEISFLTALTGLIILSVLSDVFPSFGILFILQSGFEAGTVGGAADWLAVKMIFDEIKVGRFRVVPASGIIPRKQKAIAAGAGKLVAEEWLSPESVARLLATVDVSGVMGDYLENAKRSGETSKWVQWLADQIVEFLNRPATHEKISAILKEQLAELKWSKLIGRNISDDHIKKILNALVPFLADKLSSALTTREAFDLIQEKLSQDQGGFLKKLLFDPVEATENAVLKSTQFLRELQYDEFHPVREKIFEAACRWLNDLRDESVEADSLDQLGKELADNWNLDAWITKALAAIQKYVKEQTSDSQSRLNLAIRGWLDAVIDKLRNDSEWKTALNQKVIAVVGEMVSKNHYKIGELVEKNLSSLSPDEIKNQFKARTYDDMQWIRVNGAVAGFAIGLIIGAVRWLLH